MDQANASTPPNSLEAASVVPIAQLCPDLPDPRTKAVGGVVTITWPYNSVQNTFSFYLAEPDFRLRRNKGQVRIDFAGRVARAAREFGLGSNDGVLLSLEGAAWEPEAANKRQSLPDAGLGWRLVFSDLLCLRIQRAETGKVDMIVVDEQSNNDNETPSDPTPIQSFEMTKSPSPVPPFSPIRNGFPTQNRNDNGLNDGEFASPAFVKRARMSYGSLFEGGFDIFEEDGGVKGMGRKRARTGWNSSAWRYTSQSPSPEPAAASPNSADENASSPTRAAGSAARVEMVDEGCQVMDLDQPLAQSTGAPEAQANSNSPEVLPTNDLPPDTEPTEPFPTEQLTQTADLNNKPERIVDVLPAPTSSDALASQKNASPPPVQQNDVPDYSITDGTWNTDTTIESHSQELTSHLHMNVPFPSASLGSTTPGTQPPQFDEVDGLTSKSHTDSDVDRMPIGNDTAQISEFNLPMVDYPPLDVTEDAQPNPIRDEALTNYPASYLDNANTSQPSHLLGEQNPDYSEVSRFGPASWVTINHTTQSAAMPPIDGLSNGDGVAPKQDLITHDSGTASDSNVESMVTMDTVHDDRTYTQDMYENVETDDEADAQYSDEDEAGYDEDEIGGDYDARNYEKPDDDDDDSHDEDLQYRRLEPEFGHEESWDEAEEAEFDEEDYESEMSDEIINPPPQLSAPAEPTVIDLISSSEDENGNESENDQDNGMADIQRPTVDTNSRIWPSHRHLGSGAHSPRDRLDDEGFEMVSKPTASQVGDSSEGDRDVLEYTSSREEEDEEEDEEDEENEEDEDELVEDFEDEGGYEDEDEGEYEDEEAEEYEDDEEVEEAEEAEEAEDDYEEGEENFEVLEGENESVDRREPMYMREQPENQTQQAKSEVESGFNAEHDNNSELDSTQDHEDISSQTRLETKLPETIDITAAREIPEEGPTNVPLSAADGLDILSRTIDEESKANHGTFSTSVTEEMVVEYVDDKQPLAGPLDVEDIEMRDFSNHQETTMPEMRLSETFTVQGDGQRQGDPITSPKADAKELPVIDHRQSAAAAPFSPPSTQSFQSRFGEYVTSAFEEIAAGSFDQMATAHLPTPVASQISDVTDVILNHTTSSHIDSVGSVELPPSAESKDVTVVGLTPETTVDYPSHQDIETQIQDDVEQEDDSTRTFQVLVQEPPDEPAVALSTEHGSETQTNAGQLVSSGVISQDKAENQPTQPDVTWSFVSLMEVDDELQASIREDAEIDEYTNHDQPISADADGGENAEASSEADTGLEPIDEVEEMSSSSQENTPEKQIDEEASAQLERYVSEKGSDHIEDSSPPKDNSSVYLARLSIASKNAKDGNAQTHENRFTEKVSTQLKKLFGEGSPPAEYSETWTDNPSVCLARDSIASKKAEAKGDDRHLAAECASLSSRTSMFEDNSSMAAAKLQLARHLRDELVDFACLKMLRQHLAKKLDVIAVAVMQPAEPRRAKGGPREFMMSFTISDYSIGPHVVDEVLIYRPYKDRLPVVKYGDVLLLRNFTTVALPNKGVGLRSNEESSWAVFDYEDEPAQIRGPPVEYGECEVRYVAYSREWFRLLDAKAKAKLERANQKIINSRELKLRQDSF